MMASGMCTPESVLRVLANCDRVPSAHTVPKGWPLLQWAFPGSQHTGLCGARVTSVPLMGMGEGSLEVQESCYVPSLESVPRGVNSLPVTAIEG